MSQFSVTIVEFNGTSLGLGTLTLTPTADDQVSIHLVINSGTLSGFDDTVTGTISQCNNGQTNCITYQSLLHKGLKQLFLNTYSLAAAQASAGVVTLSFSGQTHPPSIIGGGGIGAE